MINLTLSKSTLIVALLLISHCGYADLIVNRSIIIFDNPSESKQDVRVFNSDELNNLYLRVDPYVVSNPGSASQSLVSLPPGDTSEFLASPNRLILPPGSRSLIRMLNLGTPTDAERVYRINLIPISAPQELTGQDEYAVSSNLNIVVAYQVLAIVLPVNPEPIIDFSRTGNSVTFTNPGNANYLVTDGVQCDPVMPSECVDLADKRIYPGNSWEMELPFSGTANFKIRTHDGHRTLTVN